MRAGETLHGIARQLAGTNGRSTGNFLDEVVAANPTAFVEGNPNLLREGSVLNLRGRVLTDDTETDGQVSTDVEVVLKTIASETASKTQTNSTAVIAAQLESSLQVLNLQKQLSQSTLVFQSNERASSAINSRLSVLKDKIELLESSFAQQDQQLEALTLRIAALQAKPQQLATKEPGAPLVANEIPTEPASIASPNADTTTSDDLASVTPKRSLLDRLASTPTLVGGLLAALLLVSALAWFLRYRRRKGMGTYLDHRDKDADDAQNRLAALRESYEQDDRPQQTTKLEETLHESFVITPQPAALTSTPSSSEPTVSARGLAMESAASLEWGDYDTAKTKVDQAIAIEPDNQEHQLVLLRVLNSAAAMTKRNRSSNRC